MLGDVRAQEVRADRHRRPHRSVESREAASVQGHANALTFKVLATDWVECEPFVHKTAAHTTAALQQIFGPKDVVGFAHSDESHEVCKILGLRQRMATPGHC